MDFVTRCLPTIGGASKLYARLRFYSASHRAPPVANARSPVIFRCLRYAAAPVVRQRFMFVCRVTAEAATLPSATMADLRPIFAMPPDFTRRRRQAAFTPRC